MQNETDMQKDKIRKEERQDVVSMGCYILIWKADSNFNSKEGIKLRKEKVSDFDNHSLPSLTSTVHTTKNWKNAHNEKIESEN